VEGGADEAVAVDCPSRGAGDEVVKQTATGDVEAEVDDHHLLLLLQEKRTAVTCAVDAAASPVICMMLVVATYDDTTADADGVAGEAIECVCSSSCWLQPFHGPHYYCRRCH
jgi:hypothetical protein